MEQWEIELRAKLEAELPEGCYEIGSGSLIAYTDKRGYIEYEVALQNAARGLTDVLSDIEIGKTGDVGSPTIEDFKEMMKELNKKQDGNV